MQCPYLTDVLISKACASFWCECIDVFCCQVWELQQTIQSLTSHMFHQTSMDQPPSLLPYTNDTDSLGTVRVLEYSDKDSNTNAAVDPNACYWSEYLGVQFK
jgi:hypothetical protein